MVVFRLAPAALALLAALALAPLPAARAEVPEPGLREQLRALVADVLEFARTAPLVGEAD